MMQYFEDLIIKSIIISVYLTSWPARVVVRIASVVQNCELKVHLFFRDLIKSEFSIAS